MSLTVFLNLQRTGVFCNQRMGPTIILACINWKSRMIFSGYYDKKNIELLDVLDLDLIVNIHHGDQQVPKVPKTFFIRFPLKKRYKWCITGQKINIDHHLHVLNLDLIVHVHHGVHIKKLFLLWKMHIVLGFSFPTKKIAFYLIHAMYKIFEYLWEAICWSASPPPLQHFSEFWRNNLRKILKNATVNAPPPPPSSTKWELFSYHLSVLWIQFNFIRISGSILWINRYDLNRHGRIEQLTQKWTKYMETTLKKYV